MPLREESERHGNWLFQRRSWLPLLLYPFAIGTMYAHPEATAQHITSNAWGLLCLGVSLLGLGVRACTIGFTPQGTSGRNTDHQVAESLNQTGLYSVVRHPLYLGNFLMWLGLFMFIGVWWFVAICSLLYWLYYERIMYAEEEFLRRKYGGQYEQWASRTPAFIPRLSGWVPAPLPFSFKNVLKREYNGLFAIVISFVVLVGLSRLFEKPQAGLRALIDIGALWRVVFWIGAAVFVGLRTLKKNTHVLDITGR